MDSILLNYVLMAIMVLLFLLINGIYWLMGYLAGWRWLGLVSFFCLPAAWYSLYMISAPFYLGITLFICYLGGAWWYQKKHGAWPVSTATRQMAENVLIVEDTEDPAIVWETEIPIISRHNLKTVLPWTVPPVLLFIAGFFPDAPDFLVTVRDVLIFLMGISLVSIFIIMTNRTRYMYGCTTEAYGISITDPRILGTSSFNTVIGAMEGNPTLAASGLLAGNIGRVRRPWSEAKEIKYNDLDCKIIIRDGWRGSKTLNCPEALYPQIKKFIQDKIVEKMQASRTSHEISDRQ